MLISYEPTTATQSPACLVPPGSTCLQQERERRKRRERRAEPSNHQPTSGGAVLLPCQTLSGPLSRSVRQLLHFNSNECGNAPQRQATVLGVVARLQHVKQPRNQRYYIITVVPYSVVRLL